ncbi:hypothetical protein, partial [Pseudomonas monteilii]|uniref:hypothetical protein n=1 Tax=Pseudomonas monteilii TaxID=76759 RepID=UPI001C712B67
RVSTFTTLSTARLIHNCRGLNRQAALGHFSIGRVGQFSISADTQWFTRKKIGLQGAKMRGRWWLSAAALHH